MTKSGDRCLEIHGRKGDVSLSTRCLAVNVEEFVKAELVDVSAAWGPGFTTVFVDFLRDNQIIKGVGLTPFGEFAWLLEFGDFENAEVEGESRLLVYFSESESFRREISRDHAMLRTRLFQHRQQEEFSLLMELPDDLEPLRLTFAEPCNS